MIKKEDWEVMRVSFKSAKDSVAQIIKELPVKKSPIVKEEIKEEIKKEQDSSKEPAKKETPEKAPVAKPEEKK